MCAVILKGNNRGCTAKPILQHRFKVQSMHMHLHVASTLYCRELVMTVNIPVQERNATRRSSLAQGVQPTCM